MEPGLRLLLVDDSEQDIFLVETALQRSGVREGFQAVQDGAEAIAYLRGQGPFADRRKFFFPNVLVCDLKMPGVDGFGLLRWLREHPECKVIPTIIFSSSYLEKDVHEAYALGANAFISKPASLNELGELMRATWQFWSRCHVPPPPPHERCG